MKNKFCTQTAREIRKLGYAPKVAARCSVFIYLSMLSVSGMIVAGMRCRKGLKSLEETPQLRTPAVTITTRNTGHGIIIAAPIVVDIVPASSRLRSN